MIQSYHMNMFLKRYAILNRFVKPILTILVIMSAVLVASFSSNQQSDTGVSKYQNHRSDIQVEINNIILDTQIAQTSQDRATGLSNHTSLGEKQAMLFIFQKPGVYSFWMKDMDFPIDIFWLNENKEIIFIKENAQPESYPESFGPKEESLYVLETVTGFSNKHDIKIGDTMDW